MVIDAAQERMFCSFLVPEQEQRLTLAVQTARLRLLTTQCRLRQASDPQFWNEAIKTVGATDLYVQQNTWDPGTCGGCVPSTGWHTHPGPSFVIVTQGSVTVYDGDDPACAPHVYTAGTPNNAFVDPGGGHVHIIRDESGAVAKTVAVQFVPAGAIRRQDAPDPGNCPF